MAQLPDGLPRGVRAARRRGTRAQRSRRDARHRRGHVEVAGAQGAAAAARAAGRRADDGPDVTGIMHCDAISRSDSGAGRRHARTDPPRRARASISTSCAACRALAADLQAIRDGRRVARAARAARSRLAAGRRPAARRKGGVAAPPGACRAAPQRRAAGDRRGARADVGASLYLLHSVERPRRRRHVCRRTAGNAGRRHAAVQSSGNAEFRLADQATDIATELAPTDKPRRTRSNRRRRSTRRPPRCSRRTCR